MSEQDVHHHAHGNAGDGARPRTRWPVRLLMFALLGVLAYYVITEHGAHLLAAWPLLFLAACPLMHLFHGGHGGHANHGEAAPQADQTNTGDPR